MKYLQSSTVAYIIYSLLCYHIIHYVTNVVYSQYCARSLVWSVITHGSYVCNALAEIQRTSVAKYAIAMNGIVTLIFS